MFPHKFMMREHKIKGCDMIRAFGRKTRQWMGAGWTTAKAALLAVPGASQRQDPPPTEPALSRLFSQLLEVEVELKTAVQGMEGQFLTTGAELEELHRFSTVFIQGSEKLIGLATGREDNGQAFSHSIKLIEQPMELLTRCHLQTGRTLQELRRHKERIEQLLGIENDLRNTMAPLRYLQVQFKVVSAPLGPEVQAMFMALTLEIEKLQEQVSEIFGTQFQELQQTHRVLEEVIRLLERQVAILRQVVTTQQTQIQSSLGQMRQELRVNQEREVQLSDLSRQIGREVEQVVLGLQYQDIINQKLQHVMAALPQIHSRFAQGVALPEHQARDIMQYLYQSCTLEARQLHAAREDLDNAEKTIQQGIRNVSSRLSQVDSQCLSLQEFNTLTTSWDGTIQVLLDSIEAMRALVNQAASDASRSHQMLQPLGRLATGLTTVVRQLSARIHLIGLNAQVQAARLEQGAGLEVLSARTSEIAQETIRISDSATGQLDQLAAGLSESVRWFDQLHAEAFAQQQWLNDQGRAEEQRLHAFRDEALNALRAIGNSLEAIQRQAHQTVQTAHFRQHCEEAMARLQASLLAIAQKAEDWLVQHGAGVNPSNHVEELKRDYTMASERQVYDHLLTSALRGVALVTAPPSSSPSEVELFVDPVPESPPGAARSNPPPSESACIVSSPRSEALEESRGSGPETATKSLGDNVELF